MSGMLNTLLDINQLEAGIVRPEIVDFPIDELLDDCKTEFAYHATAKRPRLARGRRAACVVRSDPRLLEQMIRNLLSNAVKYTEHGKILLGCRRRGDKLRIEVWDTGIGIPAEQLQAIFEEFHQLDNPARERSAGSASVFPSCNAWAISWASRSMSAPVRATARSSPSRCRSAEASGHAWRGGRQSAAQATAPHTARILIIEDDPAVREMLALLFEERGTGSRSPRTGSRRWPWRRAGRCSPTSSSPTTICRAV